MNKMPRVAIVRARAIDHAIHKVAEDLSTQGYEVTLLVWDRAHNTPITPNVRYRTRAFQLRAPYDKATIAFYLPIWWLYEFYSLWTGGYDILHACDLDTLFPAIIVKALRKKKLCYLIYDFYADNLTDGRLRLTRSAIRAFVGTMERMGIGFADVLFLVDESRIQQVRGARIQQVVYLYNTPRDDHRIERMDAKASVKKSADELLLFYAGGTEPNRGIRFMLDAINDTARVRMVLASGLIDERMRERLKDGSGSVQCLGWLPSYDEVLAWTRAADTVFRFSDPASPKTRYASPNKLFEAMMCGKPVIVSDESRMADIVREEHCGIVVPYGDVERLKDVITLLRDDVDLRSALGKNGRRAYEERYNWDIMTGRLLDAYDALWQAGPAEACP